MQGRDLPGDVLGGVETGRVSSVRPGLSQCLELPTYEATPSDIATSSFPLHRLAAHRAGGVGVWWVPVGQPNRGKARVCSRMAVLGLSKRTEASEAGVRRDGREAKFLKLRRSSVGFFVTTLGPKQRRHSAACNLLLLYLRGLFCVCRLQTTQRSEG